MNVLATLNRNVSVDDMVLCYFNIRLWDLINGRHGVLLPMRRLLQICKKLSLNRQINIHDGTLYSILSNELGKYQLQVFFTKNSNSFLYAASTRNQQIEALKNLIFLGG